MCKCLKFKFLVIGMLVVILFGCSKNESDNAPQLLNSFSMNLNDQSWEPSILSNDPCSVTYKCNWWEAGVPFYTIEAYKDYENYFRLQIKDVKDKGTYSISGRYDPFTSYARFIRNESDNKQIIYENSTTKMNSVVRIEEMVPVKYSFTKGIRGSFSGVLYNIDNPKDSIVIKNCEFTFGKINRNDFCQCED